VEAHVVGERVHYAKPYTIVEIAVATGKRKCYGRGVAKCMEIDPYNEQLGYTIAKGRAIQEIAERRAVHQLVERLQI
jgi:hypothetical protein